MATFNPNWDTSWTTTSINADALTPSDTIQTASPISNDGKAVTEISISVTYDSGAVGGITVYVLRDVNGTDYEDPDNDLPWGFAMPYAVSTTCHRLFSIPGNMISKFHIYISNDSGDDATVTVSYKQATIDLT